MTKIAIVDYGMGNLASVANALQKCGAEVTLESSPLFISKAPRVLLPGVGAFAACMQGLKAVDGPRVIGRRLAGGQADAGGDRVGGAASQHRPDVTLRAVPVGGATGAEEAARAARGGGGVGVVGFSK